MSKGIYKQDTILEPYNFRRLWYGGTPWHFGLNFSTATICHFGLTHHHHIALLPPYVTLVLLLRLPISFSVAGLSWSSFCSDDNKYTYGVHLGEVKYCLLTSTHVPIRNAIFLPSHTCTHARWLRASPPPLHCLSTNPSLHRKAITIFKHDNATLTWVFNVVSCHHPNGFQNETWEQCTVVVGVLALVTLVIIGSCQTCNMF